MLSVNGENWKQCWICCCSVCYKWYLPFKTNFLIIFFPSRNVECLNLLLSSGTDLNKRDIMGRWASIHPFEMSSQFGADSSHSTTVIEKPFSSLWVTEFSLCRTPLHYAAANGRYQCTVALVSAGAEVNEPDQIGCTPLHYAAASQAFSRLGNPFILFCVLFETPS